MTAPSLSFFLPLFHGSDLVKAITIPLFTGAIGYIINWTGVWMLFHPLRFVGFRLPGLAPLAKLLPRRMQEIPGIMHGGVGWQGIIPNRAAKMGSIAADKGLAKLGTPGEFYEQLEPDKIAEHILATAQRDIRDVVERIMEREHARLWRDLPPRVREAVHARVQSQLPAIVHDVTQEIGRNIDQLLDVKLMVIRQFEERPELATRAFLEVGQRELNLMINFGFLFGFLFGIPVAFITHWLPEWWVLPVCGVIVGWLTNLCGMQVIFEPVEPRRIGPFRLHGLFLRRRSEVADVYSKIIADDVVTLGNVGDQLLHGPRSDRTRQMLETALRPAVDQATGPARGAVRVAIGARQYDTIRESVATEAVEYTMTPLIDPEFSEQQSSHIKVLLAGRMREMSYPDFVELLRSAIKEDEWMLYAHGAVLGFGAGLLHLGIFGVCEVMADDSQGREARRRDEVMSSLPGLARIYGSAWYHTAEWAAEASAKATSRVVRAAISRESPGEFLDDMGDELRGYARRFLGIVDAEGNYVPDAVSDLVAPRERGAELDGTASLRERGAELLRRSADVDYVEDAHPAYERILTELAPDEGRILRLLAEGGPQPSIDVRTVGLVIVGSELVGAGFTMIGAEAGCRHVYRVHAYLNNLFRLGLVWFSREPVSDSMRYQVLEAQPEVLKAMREAGRTKTVRRSIHLTPFGEDFCNVCLPLGTAELEALPGDSAPADEELEPEP